MRIRAADALPLGVMILLAGLTLALQYAVQEYGSGEAPAKRHEPDAVVENFSVKRLGQTGKPEYALSAPKMVHFADDDSMEMLYPRIVHFDAGGTNLTATANRGVFTKNGEEGFFYGNVALVREASSENDELRVRTEFLQLINEKHIARTDQPVVITEGNSVVSGVGMELQQDTRELKLFSQVRGTIDAKKK
jgi:lipopolysaccharide export system protein LptC